LIREIASFAGWQDAWLLSYNVCFSSQQQGLINPLETEEELEPQERMNLARTALLGKPDSGTRRFESERLLPGGASDSGREHGENRFVGIDYKLRTIKTLASWLVWQNPKAKKGS